MQIIETGTEGGAGNLVICELLCLHLNENVLNEAGQIDPHKIDLVARMGGDYYCRASGDAVFTVPKPNTLLGIGIDALPEHIRNSSVLTGNHLGLLGNCSAIPVVETISHDERLSHLLREYDTHPEALSHSLHQYAAELLDRNEIDRAWEVLLSGVNEGKELRG